jgi:trimeric autotransporter adhesin
MNPLIQRTTILPLLIGLALACFGLSPQIQAVSPTPDGCYPGFTTAEGCRALNFLTTGAGNTGVGWYSLFLDTTGSFNTGVGAGTLVLNTADSNTAVGAAALLLNTTGGENTAVGTDALVNNDSGSDNNAVGAFALFSNVSGFFNNAHGREALTNNTAGENNAFGDLAMENNTTGASNTAIGDDALRNNVDGSFNVAVGDEAGTGLGASVNNCIAIGAPGDGPFAVLDNTCFIGSIFGEPVSDPGSQVPVYVDQFNNVGVFNTSSRKLKHDIQPMNKSSETLYQFKPVTFKYNSDWKGTTQYGLIAEEVAEVDPQLVVRGRDGEIMAVHYEQINNMLLNEFLKEHKKVEELQATVAQQQKGMEVLTAQLKEQAAQIQKVSTQLEVSKPAPQVVVNKP